MHNYCTPHIIKGNFENFLIHRCNYTLLSQVYFVWEVVKTPTLILNNPVYVEVTFRTTYICRMLFVMPSMRAALFRILRKPSVGSPVSESENAENLPAGRYAFDSSVSEIFFLSSQLRFMDLRFCRLTVYVSTNTNSVWMQNIIIGEAKHCHNRGF